MKTTIIHKPEIFQINVLDNRYYTLDNVTFFPSVTSILEVYPKGFGFNQWLKDVGNNASEIAERAAEQGSRVHNACDQLAKGYELQWINEAGEGVYSLEEWKMILRFKEFIQLSGAKIVHNERSLCSPELGYGGTIDLVIELDGKLWLIDIKTSNYLHTVNELQVAAYAAMYNKEGGIPIHQTGILWLKGSTRTDKIDHAKGIYQGKGWQLKTFDRHYNDAYKIFEYTHKIYLEENPVCKPLNLQYPDTIKL